MNKKNILPIEPLLRLLLRFEGGIQSDRYFSLEEAFEAGRARAFSNDPDDRGGATFCGVTLATYRRYLADYYGRPDAARATPYQLRQLSFFDWENIIRRYYWSPLQCDKMRWPCVALCVADYGFNSGIDRAAHALQEALNEIASHTGLPYRPLATDGVVGPCTIDAIRQWLTTRTRANLVAEFVCDQRWAFVEQAVGRGAIHRKYYNGLKRRIEQLRYVALRQ